MSKQQQTQHQQQQQHQTQPLYLWNVNSSIKSLGLTLRPKLSSNRKGWIVDTSTLNLSVRRGMTLTSIQYSDTTIDPSTFNRQQLIEKLQSLRPVILCFLPAPVVTRTSTRLRALTRTLTIQLNTPSPIGLEFVPTKSFNAWMIANVGKAKTVYPSLRRGMILMYANNVDMRQSCSRTELFQRLQSRPMELVFKAAPRSQMSRRLKSRRVIVSIDCLESKNNLRTLGIELTTKKAGGIMVVHQSNRYPKVRRGMTLRRINNIDLSHFNSVNAAKAIIKKEQKSSSSTVQLEFMTAPVRHRSLSPETRDRHRWRGPRPRIVRIILCGNTNGQLGLHLKARHRGGVVLGELSERLVDEWKAWNPSSTENKVIPIRRGFTLLAVNGQDVSVKDFREVQEIVREHCGTPFETVWRAPPRNSRSQSPSIRGRLVPTPPPNRHVEVLRVVHNPKLHGKMGLELVPSIDKSRILVKSVHGWSYNKTEIRRGMVVSSLNGIEVHDMLSIHKNRSIDSNNIFIFRSAPAAVLTNKQRTRREAQQARTLFTTVFEKNENRTSFGLQLVSNKDKTKILLSKFSGECTNSNLLRRGCELIRINDIDVRSITSSSVGSSSIRDVVNILSQKIQSTVKLVWFTVPATSLSAKIFRMEQFKHQEHHYHQRGHMYHINRLKKKRKSFGAIQCEARSLVGLSLDLSTRTSVHLIRQRKHKLLQDLAQSTVKNALDFATNAVISQQQLVSSPVVPIELVPTAAGSTGEEILSISSPIIVVPKKKKKKTTKHVNKDQKKTSAHYLMQSSRKSAKVKVKNEPLKPTKKKKDRKTTPEKIRICVTLSKSEHDPSNGIYWIKSKELLDGTAERNRLKKQKERRKEKLRQKKEKEKEKENKKTALKLAQKFKSQQAWKMLNIMTTTSPTKIERKVRAQNRARKRNGVNGLPILSTLLVKEQVQLDRILSSKDDHYQREREEAERLMRQVLTEDENTKNKRKRRRPLSANPTRREGTSVLLEQNEQKERTAQEQQEQQDQLEYYRTTKGLPLFTGGSSPFRRRPSSAPRLTPVRIENENMNENMNENENEDVQKEEKKTAVFNMTESHRNLIVRTALETVPNEFRTQYKPALIRLLWSRAMNLLSEFFSRQISQKMKDGITIWKLETIRRRKILRKQKSVQLQCWWRTVASIEEVTLRYEMKKQRIQRQLKIEIMERTASTTIQSFVRAEICRIKLGWKGRLHKRRDARQKIILLQRRWRGAAAKLLTSSIALLRRQNESAASLLQRWMRGCLGRQKYRLSYKLHNIEDRANKILLKREQIQQSYRMNGAATALQHWWLEMLRRERMRIRKHLIKSKAAFKLTRWIRGVFGRIRFQAALRGELGANRAYLQERSTLLQNTVRIFIAKCLLKRMKYVHTFYAQLNQDERQKKKKKSSRLVTKIKKIPHKTLYYAKNYMTPFHYRTKYQASITIQKHWRRRYYQVYVQKMKLFRVRRRRRKIRYFTIRMQAKVRGHQMRKQHRNQLEKMASTKVQKIYRGYYTRIFPAYDRAARMIQAIWRGTEALKDFRIQNKSGSDGPLMEARKLIMKQYHKAFHGPARIWLSKRRLKKQREYRKWYKETIIVGKYEYLRTKIRRSLWLLRCSIRVALASGKSKIGGFGGSQGSGSGNTIAERIFRAASTTRKNQKHLSGRGSSGGTSFVMKMKQWKQLTDILTYQYFQVEEKKKNERNKKNISKHILPSMNRRLHVQKLEMIFSSSKSRGDGLTFDDFIKSLSKVYHIINDESKRMGGYYWLKTLRNVNHVWGGLIQPASISQWIPLDDHGNTYWYHKNTMESRWKPPPGVVQYNQLLNQESKESTPNQRHRTLKDPESVLDHASTVFSLLLAIPVSSLQAAHSNSNVSSTMHKNIRRILYKCVHKDMHTIIKRLQRKWKRRPNLLSVLLDASYKKRYQEWCISEQNWAALTIQCAVRRHWARHHTWKLVCQRITKYQLIETDEIPPIYHKDAPPTLTSRTSQFWYDKGRRGKSASKHWTIPPLLARYLGDVPIVPIDHDTVNPLCQFCGEDTQWNGHENDSTNGNNNDNENHDGVQVSIPWWDVARSKQMKHARRKITRRCNDCLEMYCTACFHRCHRHGQQSKHTYTPMQSCEKCNYLLATSMCFSCAAHPLWKERYDLGDENSTGRKYYYNAHIGRCKGGVTSWKRPFGYNGGAYFCEGCLHVSHPTTTHQLQNVHSEETTSHKFLDKMNIKDQKWKHSSSTTKTRAVRKRAVHRYKALTKRCDECGSRTDRPAIWSCHACGYFCTQCLNTTHSVGNRQYHEIEQYCELLIGDGFDKEQLEKERLRKKKEMDRLQQVQAAMYKLDLLKATRRVQRFYRRRKIRQRQKRQQQNQLLMMRKRQQQLRVDNKYRQTSLYRVRRGLGMESFLVSDDMNEKGRKNMQFMMLKGTIPKLVGSSGRIQRVIKKEYKLPGLVKMQQGHKIAYTTVDLTTHLKRGDYVRIGPTSIYQIQNGEQNHENEHKNDQEEEGEDLRPFTKIVLPLSTYWWHEDGTHHIYYIQNAKEMFQTCPPESAKDVIDDRLRAAWLLANPPAPTQKALDAIEERRKRKEEQEERDNATYFQENSKVKEKRLLEEKAQMNAKMNKLKNRAKLKAGGRKGRAQRMKSLKKNQAIAAKLAAEEEQRINQFNNSTGFEDTDA